MQNKEINDNLLLKLWEKMIVESLVDEAMTTIKPMVIKKAEMCVRELELTVKSQFDMRRDQFIAHFISKAGEKSHES